MPEGMREDARPSLERGPSVSTDPKAAGTTSERQPVLSEPAMPRAQYTAVRANCNNLAIKTSMGR